MLSQASMVGNGAQWPLISLKTVTRWWQCALAHCYATVHNCCFIDIEAMHDVCASIIIAPRHPRSIRLSRLTPGRGTFMNNAIIVEECKQHCLCSLLSWTFHSPLPSGLAHSALCHFIAGLYLRFKGVLWDQIYILCNSSFSCFFSIIALPFYEEFNFRK